MGFIDWLSSQTETKNNFQAQDFADSKNYNANAFEYGGQPGGADAAAGKYSGLAANAQGRIGAVANYQQANEDRGLAMQARGGQQAMAGQMMARAQGLVPSIAQQQADRQMGQATAAQASAAASARGPAALALAQQNAAANTANAQGNISGQAQVNAANERMQAEQAAMGAFGSMRGQDAQSQAQSAQQAQYQAGLQQQQHGLNDQMTLGMTQNEMGVRQQQMQGQMNQQQMMAQSHNTSQQLAAGVAKENAGTNMAMLGSVMKAGEGAAGAIANLSDERAKQDVESMATGLAPDLTRKFGVAHLGGPNGPVSGPAATSIDKLRADGSLDVLGSLKAHSDFATRFTHDPSGGMVSDSRAKQDARIEGLLAGLRAGDSAGSAMGHDMTSQLGSGLAPYSYEYKPGMGTEGRKVGPMAQAMVANPVTATAIRQDPGTGLLAIDRDDGLKVALGGVGHLAQKQSAQDRMIAELMADRGRPNRSY